MLNHAESSNGKRGTAMGVFGIDSGVGSPAYLLAVVARPRPAQVTPMGDQPVRRPGVDALR